MGNLNDLPKEWRERAKMLRDYGGGDSAKAWDVAAAELDQALRDHNEDTLTLTEAAKVSGYTADHLGELVRSGKLPNAGRPNAPAIRRSDLPTKPAKRGRPRAERSSNQRADVLRAARRFAGD
jgi:hypothetical protein